MALEDVTLKRVELASTLGKALHKYGVNRAGERRWTGVRKEYMYNECRGYMTTEILSGENSYLEIGILAGFETPEDETMFVLTWS